MSCVLLCCCFGFGANRSATRARVSPQERDRKRRVKQRWEKGLGGATVTPWKVRGTSHGRSWGGKRKRETNDGPIFWEDGVMDGTS